MKPEPDVRVVGVPSYEVAAAWPHVVDMLKPAIAFAAGAYEADDILADCTAKDSQLWAMVIDGELSAAAITRIVEYPRLKSITVPLVGGSDMVRWWPAFRDRMIAFGRSHGCTRLEGGGRRGWAKMLPGMVDAGCLLRMEI